MYAEMIQHFHFSSTTQKVAESCTLSPTTLSLPAGGLGPVTGDRTASTIGAGAGEASAALPDSCGSVSWRTSMGLGRKSALKIPIYLFGGCV